MSLMPSTAECMPAYEAKIVVKPVARMAKLGRQARTHTKRQVEQIAESIRRYGFLQPLVIDDHHRVVVGAGRLTAAKLLEISEVPCIVASHLTEAELRAYVLADNRLGDLSDFDRDILAIEMSELSNLSLDLGMELTIPGFDQVEIETLGLSTSRTAMAPEPAYPETAVTRRGDIWRLGDHRILCGDATQDEDHAALMREDIATASFLDPPYSVKVRGHVTSSREHREFAMGTGEMTDAEFINFLASTISKAADHIIDGGVIYACIDWRHVQHMLEAMVRCGLTLLNIAVWVKPAPGMGSFLRSQHEFVCIGRRGARPHNNRVELGSGPIKGLAAQRRG